MTIREAIEVRKSNRNYFQTSLKEEHVKALEKCIEEVNAASGLKIQLIQNRGEAFAKSYLGVKGASCYFAMVGDRDMPYLHEKIGYYGERLVLEATALGLGTCWLNVNYNEDLWTCELGENDKLVIIVAVGESAEEINIDDEFAVNMSIHRSTRPIEYMYTADGEVPDWFIEGMKAVAKAPSSQNSQPVKFFYCSSKILAYVDSGSKSRNIELGVAELHFELASGVKVFDKE